MARLLACKSCGVMYKLPDYDGPPEYDMSLIDIIDRHLAKAADPRPESHISLIFRCDDETAAKLDVETTLKSELAKYNVEVHEMRDDFKTEALACFDRHSRPKQGCIDYEDDSKTIGRRVGIPKDKRMYLCHFCPAQDFVTHSLRVKKGMYD